MARKAWMAASLALLLAGCGKGLSGTFEDQYGLARLAFDGDGTVVQTSTLGAVELRLAYEMDGERVRIVRPGAGDVALVLTRVDEDTLAGPAGLQFRRVAE